MRICIDMGHTPTSPGAGGQFDELTADRQLGTRVIAELERRGHTVYNSTPPDWMGYPDEIDYRISYANARDIDLFVSIHFNALNGNAYGTEVLYYSGDSYGLSVANRMCEKVCAALGTYNRGAKPRTTEIGVIRDTNATAVLLETCFCDNSGDAEKWYACPWDTIVSAVCDGITGEESEEEVTDNDIKKIASAIAQDMMNNNIENVPQWGEMGKGTGKSYKNNFNIWRWTYDNVVALRKEVAELKNAVSNIKSNGAIATTGVDIDAIAKKVADELYNRLKA